MRVPFCAIDVFCLYNNFAVLFTFQIIYDIIYLFDNTIGAVREFMKETIKEKLKKLIQFLLNPRFLLCFGLAWMITNGWCYIFIGVGSYYDIEWMFYIGTTYLAFLWLPITPEKIITIPMAIAFLKWFFPKDQSTLAVLEQMYQKAKDTLKGKRKKKKEADTQNETQE